MKVRRMRVVQVVTLSQVSKIVGLKEGYIKQLEREGRFPKRLKRRHRKPTWSKLRVYYWLKRWGIRSDRPRT